MPKLVIQEGYRRTSEFHIPKGDTTIGRGTDNDLVLSGRGVSRHHVRIRRTADQVSVSDLGSRNGSFLNAAPILKETPVKHTDVIQLGEVVLRYEEVDYGDAGPEEVVSAADTVPCTFGIEQLQTIVKSVQTNIQKVVKGKDDVIARVMIGLLSDGHILIEDVPGVGKTMLAQALAKSIRTEFKRIQFTPDLLPTDISGVNIYDDKTKEFTFAPGPVFANVVLADEINRGTPRTQSSLLECMSDAVVTVDGVGHVLQKPFFVIATQNPVDFHGTYPLPEAQLDRFLMRLRMGYPSKKIEEEILTTQVETHPINTISYVVRAGDILQCQAAVRTVHVSDAVKDYIVTLVNATREHPAFAYGASPRASLALMRASQCLAAMDGRHFVLPRDVRDLARAVLSHRLPLKLQARAEWESSEQVVDSILPQFPLERWEKT